VYFFSSLGLFSLRRVLAKEVLTRHPYSINKKKGSQLYDFLYVSFDLHSFKFPTLTPSKRSGSNTLILCVIRLSSPPLPQVSGLGRHRPPSSPPPPTKRELGASVCVQKISFSSFFNDDLEVPILEMLERLGEGIQSADAGASNQRQPSSWPPRSGVVKLQESIRSGLQV